MIRQGFCRVGAVMLFILLMGAAGRISGQTSVNIDIQSGNGDTYHGVSALSRTPAVWNHVTGSFQPGLRDSHGQATGWRIDLNGFEDRFRTGWTEHDLLRDFVYKRGANFANAIVSGLDSARRYDVYIYPSPDGGKYRVGGVEKSLKFAGTGVGGDPSYDRGAVFVSGKNYVAFQNVSPDASGKIAIEFTEDPSGPSNAGGVAGLTIVQPNSINFDRQVGAGVAYQGPNITAAAAEVWNHVAADQSANLFNASGQRTTVGLTFFGASGRDVTTWTDHPLFQDYLFRAAGGLGTARLTGLGTGEQFDLYLYPGPDGAWFEVGGFGNKTLDFQGTGPGGDPDYATGAALVEGDNYVVFRGVTASHTGELTIQYGDSPSATSTVGSLAGVSLVSRFGNTVIHVDVQGNSGGRPSHGPAAPAISGAFTPQWNHSGSDLTSGLVDEARNATPISLQLQHANGAFVTGWTSHALYQDFNYRNTSGRGEGILRGLDPNLAYSLYLLPSVDGSRFTVGSQSLDAVFQGTGLDGDPDYAPGAMFKRGVNVAAFEDVYPAADGSITFHYEDSPLNAAGNSGFAGLTLTYGATNSPNTGTLPGIADGLVSLNGTSDFHTVPHSPAQLSRSFTLETWLRTSQSGLGRIITKTSDDGQQQQYSLYLNNGRVEGRFDKESQDGAVAVSSTSTVSDNQWHHVAAVFDETNDRLAIYVDGRQEGVAVVTELPIITSQPLTIGRFSGVYGQYFSGDLDETRVWSVARTAQELARLRHVRLREPRTGLAWASGIGRPDPTQSGAPASGRVFAPIAKHRITKFGAQKFAQVPDHQDFNTSSFTLEAWVKIPSIGGVMRVVTKPMDDGQTQRFSLLINQGKPEIRFDASNGSGAVVAAGPAAVNDDTWHHLAGVYDASNVQQRELRLYVDGRLVTVTPTIFSPGVSVAPVELGRFNAGVGQYLVGKFDEIRIWKTARSASEILASYWRPLIGGESGLVGYYRLDDAQTNSLVDSSALNHSGTSTLARESAPLANLPDLFSSAVPIRDIVVFDDTTKAVNNGNSPWQAIDGDPRTGGILSPGNTSNPQMIALDLGRESRTVNRLRVAKSADNDGDGAPDRMDLEVVYTTDTGPMALRTFHPVKGVTSGIGGKETLKVGQVGAGGVTADSHDIDAHGFYSLSFYEVSATAVALRVRRNVADSRRWTHLRLLEAELYHESAGVPVQLQKALGFDGVNDYVTINNSATLNSSGFSVEAWIRTTQSGLARIVTKPAGGSQRYSLHLDPAGTGRPMFRFDAQYHMGAQVVTGGRAVDDGHWHHVVGAYDPVEGVLKIYVDGRIVGTKQTAGIPVVSGEAVQIGRFNGAHGQFFQGSIDEVRIWNRPLSSLEVQSSYRSILTGNERGLVALLGFNEGSGTVANDESPNGNGGTLFNAPVWLDSDNQLDLSARSQVDIASLLNGSLERLFSTVQITGIKDAGLTLRDLNQSTMVSTSGELSWLGIPFRVTRATVNQAARKLSLRVEFTLFGIKNEFGQPISNAVELDVNSAGDVSFAGGRFETPFADDGKLPKIGKFMSLGNMYFEYFPAQKLIGGGMEIGFWNKLRRSPNCPDFDGTVPRIGAAFTLRGDKLDALTINLNDINQPIGAAAFLNKIQGGVNNLIDPDKTLWSFGVGFNFGCPIELPLKTIQPGSFTGGVNVKPSGYAELTGQGKLFDVALPTAFGRYSWARDQFSLGMRGRFLIYRDGEAKLTVNNSGMSGSWKGTLLTPADIRLSGFSAAANGGFGGVSIPDVKATITERGLRGSFQLLKNTSVKTCREQSERLCKSRVVRYFASVIDRLLGRLSGRRVNSYRTVTDTICNTVVKSLTTKIAFEIRADGGTSFGRVTSGLQTAAWETSYRKSSYDPGSGMRTTFMTNWERKGRATTGLLGSSFGLGPAGIPQTIFNVTSNDTAVIFRLTYQNQNVSQIDFVVKRPDGVLLHVNDGLLPAGFADGSGFGEIFLSDREATIYLEDPMPGDYEVMIGNAAELQNYAVELLSVIPEPEIEIASVTNTQTDGVLRVNLLADVGTNMPAVKFFLVEDDDPDAGGYCLSTNLVADGATSYDVDLRNLDLISGDYQIMAQVDDGLNDFVHAFSDEIIEVIDENAPAAVQLVASRSGDGSFTIQWQPGSETNLSHYEIVFTKADDPNDEIASTAVAVDEVRGTVAGLENGHPYLVSVTAVTLDGISSRIDDIHRVIPTKGFGLNPPVIVSQPDEETTAGFLYFYVPQIFDADYTLSAVSSASTNATNATNGPVEELNNQWTLVQGPTGMIIEPDSGILTWTPTQQQVGDHAIVLSVTDPFLTNQVGAGNNVGYSATQSFTLSVYDTNNLHGLNVHNHQFLSYPNLMVAEDTRFEYPVHVLGANASDYTLQIVEGPQGMTVGVVSNEYVVTWDVPAGGYGRFVVLSATFADGVEIEQEFFLHVRTSANQLPRPTTISGVGMVAGAHVINWSGGDAPYFQLQRSANLEPNGWQDVGPVVPAEEINGMADDSVGGSKVYYRIIGVDTPPANP